MSDFFTVQVEGGIEGDISATCEDDAMVSVTNDRAENGYDVECSECGESASLMVDGDPRCEEHADPDDEPEPLQMPLQWLNSAHVRLDPEGDRIVLSVSVGDPRGAWTLEVMRREDGRLMLSVPSEDDPLPHMELERLPSGALVTKARV